MHKIFKPIAAAAIFLAPLQASAQQFTLTGKLTGQPDAPLMLSYPNDQGKQITDSVTVKNGDFLFKGNVNGGVMGILYVSNRSSKYKLGNGWNRKKFFVEPVVMTASGNFNDLTSMEFTGSKLQTEYAGLEKILMERARVNEPLETQFLALNKEYARLKKLNEDDKRLDTLDKKLDALREEMGKGYDKLIKGYIADHPNSDVSAYELYANETSFGYPPVKRMYSLLTPQVQKGAYGTMAKAYLEKYESTAAGRPATDFSAKDINGKTFKLADYKGKYVILDFWASWCVPCRASTPHLLTLYHQYHGSGLEVVAIADNDDTQADWKKAIQKDNIAMWTHVLRGYNGKKDNPDDISEKYGVHTIPSKFLLDKNGIILARYDDDDAAGLDAKLAELFH